MKESRKEEINNRNKNKERGRQYSREKI